MRLATRNKALLGAWRKGLHAGIAFNVSGSKTACPYIDHRTKAGSVTFSRAFRCAWWQGFDHAVLARITKGGAA